MLLNGRTCLPVRAAWEEPRQEVNSMSMLLLPVTQVWEEQNIQQVSELEVSELEAEVQYLEPSSEAVTGESFCQCDLQEIPCPGALLPGSDPAEHCICGEEDHGFEWEWDEGVKSAEVFLSCDNRKVAFHSDYSCGTAAIRGTKGLAEGQHFWEIKMTSPVYGTDMMVGIGTAEVNLEKFKYSFCSLLGNDDDSWGLSYTGLLQHSGNKMEFSPRFGQGSIIGMHLDTWHGTLTFYKNRRCIGVAATRLQNKTFYPMVCSTAAKSSMKVIRARCTPTSLQYLCCARLRKQLPNCPDVLRALDLPPGLFSHLQSRLGWVFNLHDDLRGPQRPRHMPDDFPQEMSPLSSPGPSPAPSPVSSLSACSSSSTCSSPVQHLLPCQGCCQMFLQAGACICPPTPPGSVCESCCSEPEDYQSKRCRWT